MLRHIRWEGDRVVTTERYRAKALRLREAAAKETNPALMSQIQWLAAEYDRLAISIVEYYRSAQMQS
jgi:hypothetical protein